MSDKPKISNIKPLTAAEYLDKWDMYGLEDIYGKEGKVWLEEQVCLDKQLPESNQLK